MKTEELLALLREARNKLDGHAEDPLRQRLSDTAALRDRIDAALAEGCPDCGHPYGQQEYCQGDGHAERVDSVTPVVEPDPWWSPSSHRAKEGKCDLHVWRRSLEEWGWTAYIYREREVGSGVCNTLDEAKAAAIAAARGLR